MRSHELAQLFLEHPDMEILLEDPAEIVDLTRAGKDCFDADQGMVWVLEGDWGSDE